MCGLNRIAATIRVAILTFDPGESYTSSSRPERGEMGSRSDRPVPAGTHARTSSFRPICPPHRVRHDSEDHRANRPAQTRRLSAIDSVATNVGTILLMLLYVTMFSVVLAVFVMHSEQRI